MWHLANWHLPNTTQRRQHLGGRPSTGMSFRALKPASLATTFSAMLGCSCRSWLTSAEQTKTGSPLLFVPAPLDPELFLSVGSHGPCALPLSYLESVREGPPPLSSVSVCWRLFAVGPGSHSIGVPTTLVPAQEIETALRERSTWL